MNTTAATEPDRDGDRVVFTVHSAADLAGARATVVDRATSVGIAEERAGKAVLAVTEIATNALVHAASAAHVEIIVSEQWFLIEISDRGSGLPAGRLAGRITELPSPGQERGRGLWLAQQLCDRVEVVSTPAGVRVSLYLRR